MKKAVSTTLQVFSLSPSWLAQKVASLSILKGHQPKFCRGSGAPADFILNSGMHSNTAEFHFVVARESHPTKFCLQTIDGSEWASLTLLVVSPKVLKSKEECESPSAGMRESGKPDAY